LTNSKFSFTVRDGQFFGTKQSLDAKYWDVDLTNSSYKPDENGAQTMLLKRTNPGVEDIKIGGATYVWLKYKDADGEIMAGDYYKWADEESDGSTSLLASSAAAILISAALASF